MSKEAAARVRDELLQALYAAVLHSELAAARDGGSRSAPVGAAVAAGVCAALRPSDLLLLPHGRAEAFRVLRGLGTEAAGSPLRDREAGVLRLPREEHAAAAMALGAAAALACSAPGSVACVVLPPRPARNAAGHTSARTHGEAWQECGLQAARLGLPLLLVADAAVHARARSAAGHPGKPVHLLPAPAFPSIPVDREDALALYRVAFECVARARTQGGPSRLDCLVFRLRQQSEGEPEPGALMRLELALRKRGAFQKSWRRQLERALVTKLST